MRRIQARTGLLVLALVTLLLVASVALAQVSANHTLSWHVIAGGGGRMESAGYTLLGTTGQPLVGSMSSSGHTLSSGFWVGGAATVISGTHYVALDGTDSGDCSTIAGRCRTIQYAVDVAAPNDGILVSGGTFTSTVGTVALIAKPLVITGGYAPDFGTLDLGTYQTVLDAQWGGSVVSVTNAVSVSLQYITLTHGDGTGNCGSEGCGGGIYAHDTALYVDHCVITDNVASSTSSGRGGGIYIDNWPTISAEIRDSQIVSNTASTTNIGWGGGLFLWGGNASVPITIVGNTFESNTASTVGEGQGGGAYLFTSDGALSVLSNNTFYRNHGSGAAGWGGGGGLYLWHSDGTSLEANRFISNTASALGSGYGGAIYAPYSVVFTMTNNLLVQNHASRQGGGLWVDTSYLIAGTLVNNTLADNDFSAGGEGIWTGRYVSLTLINNLIAGHSVGITSTHPASSTISADTNLFWNDDDPITGTNAILEDPLLTVDYHPYTGSPAIDAGLTIPWLTTDLAGNPRPQGSGYDIGAYEGAITNTAPTAAFIVNPTSGYTSTVFAFDASGCSDSEDQSSALQVRWDWEDDGSYDTAWSTTKTITHTYTAVGTYTVRLEVQDTGSLTGTTTHQVAVRGGRVDYRVFLPLVQRS